MQLGFIGLGKMGMNMVARLRQGRHDLVTYDLSPDLVRESEAWQEESFAEKMLAAMRKAFGGHAVKKRE